MAARSRNFRVLLMTLGCVAAVAACNAIAGLGEDFALEPSKSDSSTTDGATGDGQVDGSADGPSTDAPVDNFVPDSSVAFFCSTADSGTNGKGECFDFEDDAGPPSFGWDTPVQREKDASVLVLPASGRGMSRGLDVYVEHTAGNQSSSNVWLAKTIGSAENDTRLEVEFEFNVVAASIFSAGIGQVTFPAAAAPNEFGVSTYNNGALVSRLATIDSTKTRNIDKGKWYRTLIVFDRPNTGSTFTEIVSVSEGAGAATEIERRMGIVATGLTEIRLGLFSTAGGIGSMHVRFDHVIVRRW